MVRYYKYGSISNTNRYAPIYRNRSGHMIPVKEDSRGNLFDCNGNLVDVENMPCYERTYYIIRKAITSLFI
jgi:hypothetical protein